MRVDLVAAPVRYPRAPLLMLLLLAFVPVAGLVALALWSDDQADAYEAARSSEAEPSESASTPQPGGPPAAALGTGLLSYRRLPGSVVAVSDANRLDESVKQIYAFMNEQSCAAVSVDGRPVTGFHVDTPVIPASTQKLIVAAVALEVLGEDYRFTTDVTAPPAVDGVVDGDLYLIGGGDPLLTSDDYPISDDTYPSFNTTSLDRLADAVVGAGVTQIRGSVVGDGTRYDDEFLIASWGDDIAYVEAGPYDALLVNDSRTLGRSSRQTDPNEAAARELARLLGNRGVSVNNGWTSGVADPGAAVIGTVESAPLSDVVAEMLTTSDDNTAEMLVKELGFADSGEGTLAGGLNVIDRSLRSWGVPMEGVRLVDGSGLSSENRTTCAAMLRVLEHATSSSLPDGLPVAATSGTLAGEFVESPVAGRLRAKSGTLGNPPVDLDPPAVKALAGYLDADNGSTIEFVMIQMGPDITTDRKYEPLWLVLGERLDTYPAGADPATVGPR